MNLKIKLNNGDKFIGHGKNKEILGRVLEGLKSGAITVPTLEDYKPQFVCFRLDESELKQLTKISDKHKISIAEILRESLRQLNLIVPTEK